MGSQVFSHLDPYKGKHAEDIAIEFEAKGTVCYYA